MKKITKRFLASLMVAVMVLSSAPLSGIAMLDWASVFATISSALSKSEEPVNASSDMACDFIQYVDIDNKDTELKHSRLNVASSRPRRMLAANKNSDNPNTYTVLLLDKEASHNLTSGGTYICTLGSPVENVKAAALKLIDQIRLTRGTTHVAIVTFDSSVQVVQNFTTDYTTMRNSIDKISSGSTWANVNGAYQKADELLSAVTDNSADKNIVLFSQGLAYAGDHTTNGIYSEEDCNWYRTDTNIHAYEYSNSAYATAQSLMSKYNIYSIGLYQSFDTVPEAGQSLLSFALSFAEDVQNSGFYNINTLDDLEFNLSEEIFNLAKAMDFNKIDTTFYVYANSSKKGLVPIASADIFLYFGNERIKQFSTDSNGAFKLDYLTATQNSKYDINNLYISAEYQNDDYILYSEHTTDSKIALNSIIGITTYDFILDKYCKKYNLTVAYQSGYREQAVSLMDNFRGSFWNMTEGKCVIGGIQYNEYSSENDFGKRDNVWIKQFETVGANVNGYGKKNNHIYLGFRTDNQGPMCGEMIAHEAGHYFFGFRDEYCYGNGYDRNGITNAGYWTPDSKGRTRTNGLARPSNSPSSFGIMESDYRTTRLSTATDYSYLSNINGVDYTKVSKKNPEFYTKQYFENQKSCSDMLNDVLNGYMSDSSYSVVSHTASTSPYYYDANTYLPDSVETFVVINDEKNISGSENKYLTAIETFDNLVEVSTKIVNDKIILTVNSDNPQTNLFIQSAENTNNVEEIALDFVDHNASCELDYAADNEYLITFVQKNENGQYLKNTYSISGFYSEISDGSFYSEFADLSANVLSTNGACNDLLIIKNNKLYVNGNFTSIDGAIEIVETDASSDIGGDIIKPISFSSDLNYETIGVFKYKNGSYTRIAQGYSEGEKQQAYIKFPYEGEGTYVIMAEPASTEKLLSVTNLSVTKSVNSSSEYTVKYEDPYNEESDLAGYNIYYSMYPFVDLNSENVYCITLSPYSKSYDLNLKDNYGTWYFVVETLGKNGAKSTLSETVKINFSPLDSDADGIPDYWIEKYCLTTNLDNIAIADPDDDGLDNLTEYQYGTNPLCPDTDGDNVYDKIELLKKLDPLNPKTDGETDDYIVAYGTPELKITNLHFDERYVYFSVENDTDSKAMRTVVDVRSGDSSIALWTVNIDGRSVIDFAVERGMLAGLDEFTISVDEGMITRDSDYSNNTFNYSASASITLNDIDVVKNTAENLVPVISPETANEIYRYTLIDGSCITLDEINGSIFADKIGQAHIQVESLSGNADTCLVSVISFEGAEYSEFECLKINETEVAITGYYGESTSVEIPESIGEFTVTAINSRAFNNIDVESISIPDSVSEISETAFYVNNTINSFIVDENNPAYCSDGRVIYNKDKTTLVAYPPAKAAETFDIPDTVTCIGSYAFNYNTFLTSISINNGISEIGSYAFYQCSSLNAINIDRSVTNIGTYAFYGCTNLSEAAYSGDINDWCKITFSSMYSNPSYYTNGIKINGQPILGEIEISSNVGAYSLYNFTDITKVTVLDGVETIGKYAFRNCSNLKDVIISNSVSSIQNGAFRDCNKIENMSIPFVGESRTVTGRNSVFGYIFDYVLLGSGTVRQYYSSSSSYEYYIPSSIKTVTITDATKIPYGAFYNCSSITDIIINDSVTNMGEKCFANCNGLVNLTIPFVGESRTAIGINGVFGYFFNSSDTSDDNTVTQYYESSGSKYYYIPTSIESITITDAEQLPYGAFYNCSMLKNISLNQKITDIGSSAFSGCSSLENTYYTGTIESWCTTNFMSSSSCPNYYAKHFYLNGELLTGELIIPDSVTDISSYSFYNFKDLESIKFSNTLQSVGTSTFYGCSGLKKVEYEGTIDDWYGLSFDNYASNPNYYAQNLLISGEPVEGRIVMPDGLEKVPNVVFAGCKDITEVVISESATSIGKSAFDRCSGLENIVIPENVTLIDQNAFCDCSSLKNLIVPCSVKYSSNGFKNCNNIEEITITKGDGTMPNLISLSLLSNYYGYTPWYTSNSIERIVIEDGVEIIGNYEFRSTSASEIIIPDSVKSIGTYAFYDNSNLNKLTVPNSVETISSKAFSSNTVIYCYNNSAAHLYAKENSLNYILLDCIYAIEGSLLTIDNDLKLISGFVNGIDALYSELNVSEGSTIFFDKSVEKVYTGMPIQVLDKNGNILSDYAAVIIGDVTGDGNYDGMDSIIVSSIVNGMLTKTDVGEAVYMAADCNRDGQITQSDVDLLTYAGVYEYDVRQVSSEKSQKADVLFANEFDFDSFGFSYSCHDGQIEDIDYENNSVIIKSESNDCYMNPWYGADNSMNLIPGHKYRIKYTAENLSDSLAIPSVLLFARNSEDSTDIDNIEYMFTELDAGQKTVFEKLYTVPENRPFVKVRLGNGAPSTVRISDIEIQDITNPYNTEETFSLPNIYGKECSIVTVNKGTSFSDFSEFLPQIYNNGYYISGWYTEKDSNGNGCGEQFDCYSAISSNIKLYPCWKTLLSSEKVFEDEYCYSPESDFISYFATARKDYKTLSGKQVTKKLLTDQGYTPLDKDMNSGAGGDYIYIGYKTGNNVEDAVRCIMAYSGGSNINETVKYQNVNGYNCAFTIVGCYPASDKDGAVDGIVDLNKGAGGDYIYLYVSKDPHAGPPITDFLWSSNTTKDGWIPVCGTSDSSDDINSAADMNRGAGGDDIVLFYKSNAEKIESDNLRYYYSLAKDYCNNSDMYTDDTVLNLINSCAECEQCLGDLNCFGASTYSQEEIDGLAESVKNAIESLELRANV